MISVYDVTKHETFDALHQWLNELEVYSTEKGIVKILVGNKIDQASMIHLLKYTVEDVTFFLASNIEAVRKRNEFCGS